MAGFVPCEIIYSFQPNVIKLSNIKKHFIVAQASCLCEIQAGCLYHHVDCATPTGLKQAASLFTHRSRSGLRLSHPDGVSLSCPVRGDTIVAYCVSGGKAIASRYQAPEGRHKQQSISDYLSRISHIPFHSVPG